MYNKKIFMLYKRTKNGATQVWSIEVENDSFRTHEGLLDGVITISAWTVCSGKNIGKKNETSPEAQAILEADAKYKKKLESGYTTDISLIDQAKKDKISPMLAHKYPDHLLYIVGKKLFSQPKLDGMRMVYTDDTFSRNGKLVVAVPHLKGELELLKSLLSDSKMIDGEIYNHALKADFNTLISYAKKSKPTAEDLKMSKKHLQYHIYDYQDENDSDFETRYNKLKSIFDNNSFTYLVLVETTLINDSNMDDIYGQYLADGYEGQMLRVADSLYLNDRSKDLLKRKEFIDEEFIITDISEGKGSRAGMMGRIHLVDKDGNHFESGCRGNVAFYKELLENKHLYIGKTATCRYQNKTDNSYRFPVVINIAREDYE